MTAFFLEGAALGFSAAAQPGPLQAYFLAQSARNGAARTLPIAAVPLVTDPVLVATVLVLLAQVPQGFVRALGVVGGAVVIWLGVGALRAARIAAPPAERAPPVGFVRAMFVNILNPNAWLYWSLGAGPRLTVAWRESPVRAVAFLAGFYVLLVCGNAALILLGGRLARAGPGVARALSLASGVVLLGFGGWTLAKAVMGA